MNNKMIFLLIGMLLITTLLPFSLPAKTNQTTTVQNNDTRDVDWWPHFRHDANHTGFSSGISSSTGSLTL